MTLRTLPYDDINAELDRRAEIIEREPWIAYAGRPKSGPKPGYARRGRIDYLRAMRRMPRRFSPKQLSEASGAGIQTTCVWLSSNNGRGVNVRRVGPGLYERRK